LEPTKEIDTSSSSGEAAAADEVTGLEFFEQTQDN
jgi:hypothetical protein